MLWPGLVVLLSWVLPSYLGGFIFMTSKMAVVAPNLIRQHQISWACLLWCLLHLTVILLTTHLKTSHCIQGIGICCLAFASVVLTHELMNSCLSTGCMFFLVLGLVLKLQLHTSTRFHPDTLCSLFCFSPLHTLPSNTIYILPCSGLVISPCWKVSFIRAHIFACFGHYSIPFVQNM